MDGKMVRSIMVMFLVLQVTVMMIASQSEAISSDDCFQECLNACLGHEIPNCSALCTRQCNPPQTNIPLSK